MIDQAFAAGPPPPFWQPANANAAALDLKRNLTWQPHPAPWRQAVDIPVLSSPHEAETLFRPRFFFWIPSRVMP